jgi:hypothetical protein
VVYSPTDIGHDEVSVFDISCFVFSDDGFSIVYHYTCHSALRSALKDTSRPAHSSSPVTDCAPVSATLQSVLDALPSKVKPE